MRRTLDIALSTIGLTIASPFILWIAVFAFALVLFAYSVVFLLVGVIAGDAGATLFQLATLAAFGYGIYRFITETITSRFIRQMLPRVNAYKELLARYDPDTLPDPHRANLEHDQRTFVRILRTRTRPDLVPDASDDRAILNRLTFTYGHFAGTPLATLKAIIETIPLDLATYADVLAYGHAEIASAQHHTVIGETFATSPRLFHAPPDPLVSVPLRDRFRHGYVIGKTGAGKTNLLKHLIRQDLENDNVGLILLSPEDSIFQSLLPAIPEHRRDDLIYFDPTDTTDPVIGFNPFDFSDADGLPPRERDAYLTLKAGETYTIFERALDRKSVV